MVGQPGSPLLWCGSHFPMPSRVLRTVNVFGVVAVTQAFIPLLRNAAKQGLPARVVYLGSVVGDVAMAETGPYSSSKFAVQAIAVH